MVDSGWRKVREQGFAQVKHLFKTVNQDVYFLSGKGVSVFSS